DAQTLAQKAADYRGLKQQALNVTGGKVTVLHEYEHFGVQHVQISDAAGLGALLAQPGVLAVRENKVRHTSLVESLPLINAPAANTAGFTGAGTTVAILDTGINILSSDFGTCAGGIGSTGCRVAAFWNCTVGGTTI